MALELARDTIRKRIQFGDDAETALTRIDEQLSNAGITWLRANTQEERHRSIEATIDISCKPLSTMYTDAWPRLAELSIFAESTSISLSAIAPLWGMNTFQAEELAQLIATFSLVKLDLRNRTVQLHRA